MAEAVARRFADRWERAYPKPVICLRDDLDELLTCFRYPTLRERKAVRTTNAVERHFREVRHRTRAMGVFQDRTSIDRSSLLSSCTRTKCRECPLSS
jgi:transposase-like protein